MSEFFKDRLDVAHALIDEHQYDMAVEIIQNLRVRIHDTDILTKINDHDNKVDNEYNNRYSLLSSRTGDPMQNFNEVQKIKKWRSQEYLTFYDKIFKDHDIP